MADMSNITLPVPLAQRVKPALKIYCKRVPGYSD